MSVDSEKTGENKKADVPVPDFDHPDISSEETMDHHTRMVEEGFWPKVRKILGRVPFAEDLCAAWYCAMDPQTPTRVRGILLAALAYFVMPADLIPDIITGFGFTDDATVIATAIGMVSGHIKAAHHEQAKTFLRKEEEAGKTESRRDDE